MALSQQQQQNILQQLNVPLAIGTLQWGTTWMDDHVINSAVLSENVCQDIVQAVTTAGIQLFDTAEGYGGGTAEKRLGRLLSSSTSAALLLQQQQPPPPQQKQQKPSSPQAKMEQKKSPEAIGVVMTKFLPAVWRGLWWMNDVERSVRASCQRLQVETIPIYLLHSPVHWRPMEYWVQQFARCHKKGFIQAMGLSNCNAEQVRRAVQAGQKYGIPVICNQVHYSLLDYNSKALQEMEAACKECNVTIVAFSPLGQGLLTDTLTPERWKTNKPAKMLRLHHYDDIRPLRDTIQAMSKKYHKTMAQVAINWCIQHSVIPLVGCRSLKQAKDSIGAVGWSLAKEDVAMLDAVALDRSTLESPSWRRSLFVSLFGIVMIVCRTLDLLGFGRVDLKKTRTKTQ